MYGKNQHYCNYPLIKKKKKKNTVLFLPDHIVAESFWNSFVKTEH